MTARSIFSRDLLTFANIFVLLLNPTLHTNGSHYCDLSDSDLYVNVDAERLMQVNVVLIEVVCL